MDLKLKIDSDGYPHVGGVRWSGSELLENFYTSLRFDSSTNTFYYLFDKTKAVIEAFDELVIVTHLTKEKVRVLGGLEYPLVSPIFLDYKERPLCFIEIEHTIVRCLISPSAYYDFMNQNPELEGFPFWWESEEVVHEREGDIFDLIMKNLELLSRGLLMETLKDIPPKSRWVFHPIVVLDDVQTIAQHNHYILCCEPENQKFKLRIEDDYKKLSKKEQEQIEYFNDQFAPEGATDFDVFFDHGLINFVHPADRQSFQEYINGFQCKHFIATIFLSHDFLGPPFGYTEKEAYEMVTGLGFEPRTWKRDGNYLSVYAVKK